MSPDDECRDHPPVLSIVVARLQPRGPTTARGALATTTQRMMGR